MILSKTTPTCSLLFFEMTIFRNSIPSVKEIYCPCAGFHPPVGFVAWARDGSVSVSGARVGHCCARGVEPPTASLAYQARVYRGCPARTHPCDTPSRVMVCQSANSVRVAFRLVRVVLCWCHLAEKLCRQVLSHSHSPSAEPLAVVRPTSSTRHCG